MSLVTFTSWISSKYSFSSRTSYGYRRSVPIKPLSKGSSAMMCSRFVRTTRPIATMSMLPMVFPDDGERVMPDFSIGDQVVRTDEIAGIYVALRDELVDVDCPGRFQRNVLEI